MNNYIVILGISIHVIIISIIIITSLTLCSGITVVEQQQQQQQQQCRQRQAGIIIDPKGILNDETKRIIDDKIQQYYITNFYSYESVVNNNAEPSEAAKVVARKIESDHHQTVPVTTDAQSDHTDNDDEDNSIGDEDDDCHSEKCIIRVRVQFAVAIVDDTTFRFHNDDCDDDVGDLLQHDHDDGNNNNYNDVEIMAEYVAKRLHNRLWGVRYNEEEEEEEEEEEGIETKKERNNRGVTISSDNDANILIYLDIRDRVVFISVDNNPNLRGTLTDERIDGIIRNEMKLYFKNNDYENGLVKGMEELVYLLKNNGEDNKQSKKILETILLDFFDWLNDLLGGGGDGGGEFVWIILVMLHCCYCLKLKQRKRQKQRVYAKTASGLSKQDTIHAEALRQTYSKTTNCPICLEDFQSSSIGVDSKPIRILQCGHVFDESCFLEWITCGRGGDITKCPICRSDVGGSNTTVHNDINNSEGYYDSGNLVGNREGNVARWSYTFNRSSSSSSSSSLMARNSSSFANTLSDDNADDNDDDSITISSSSGDNYYAFGGDDGGATTSIGGRGGRF